MEPAGSAETGATAPYLPRRTPAPLARSGDGAEPVPAMSRRQRGFALLVVLLAMGFLALLGTQLVAAGRTDTRLADNMRQAAVLQAAADGAIAHTMFAMAVAHDAAFRPDNLPRRIMEGSVPVVVQVQNE